MCCLIRFRNYISIVLLLLLHVEQKWNICPKKIRSIIIMMGMGLVLPFIASLIYGSPLDYFTLIVTSLSMGFIGVYILMVNANVPISKIIYEAKYFKRMLRFMTECYHNLIKEYKQFLKIHKLDSSRSDKESKDLTIISIIFFKIFQLYFETMHTKQKNSEPYLIDIQEMENLYHSKDFDNFYSILFFDPQCKNYNTSYEEILVNILDEVMSTLYQKSWFVEYYDEYTVFQLVKHILIHWYGDIVQYSINNIKLTKEL